MERGDHADAAALFAESLRVDPAPGTLLNLAIAENELGRLSSAWEHARGAVEQLPSSDERRKLARDLFASLDRRVPRLVLRGRGLPETARVELDGVELRRPSFDLLLPIDPGAHRVTIEAPGHLTRAIGVDAALSTTVEVLLEVGLPIDHGPTRGEPARSTGRSPLRPLGWALLGTGAAATAAGGALGGLAIVRKGEVADHCAGRFCDHDGVAAAEEGRSFATVSTIAFVAAGALVTSGLALLLVPSRSPPRSVAGFVFPVE